MATNIAKDIDGFEERPDNYICKDVVPNRTSPDLVGDNVFEEIFELSLLPMYVRVGLRIVVANQAIADLLGYGSAADLCALPSVYDIIADGARHRAKNLLDRSDYDNSVRVWHSITLRHADGSEIPVEAFRRSIDWYGRDASYLVYRDVRKERQAIEALAASEKRLQKILDVSAHGMVVHKHGQIAYANPAFYRLVECDAPTLGECRFDLYDIFTDSERLMGYAKSRLAGGEAPASYEADIQTKSGQRKIVQVRPSILEWNGERAVLACISDVTEERELQRQIEYAANYDELTGLPNRRSFYGALDRSIERTELDNTNDILVYLDLDGFKVVNDSVGHAAGDELLKQVAGCLRHCLSKNDILARLGGDEFGIILRNMPISDSQGEVKRLIASLNDYVFYHEGQTFVVGASAGVTVIKSGNCSRADYLRQADIACYAAKEKGRNRVYYFRESNKDSVRRQAELYTAAALRGAIEGHRLRLFGQAIVDLAEPHSPVHHSEILVRMCDTNDNIIGPDVFIGAAERYQMMDSIDKWVIENSFKSLSDWQQAHPNAPHPRLSLNMSGATIGDPHMRDRIHSLIERYEIDASRICFEVTETAAIRSLNQATQFITEMRKLGCRFSLDDFGTGLSSFGYLQDLHVDELKIDGRFVRDLSGDPVSRAVVSAVCNVGRALNIEVVAECVETQSVANELRELGVRFGQGYLWCRPQPLDSLFREYF